jgi:hypothetical protein
MIAMVAMVGRAGGCFDVGGPAPFLVHTEIHCFDFRVHRIQIHYYARI